jgi:hypothetical protein
MDKLDLQTQKTNELLVSLRARTVVISWIVVRVERMSFICMNGNVLSRVQLDLQLRLTKFECLEIRRV